MKFPDLHLLDQIDSVAQHERRRFIMATVLATVFGTPFAIAKLILKFREQEEEIKKAEMEADIASVVSKINHGPVPISSLTPREKDIIRTFNFTMHIMHIHDGVNEGRRRIMVQNGRVGYEGDFAQLRGSTEIM